MEVEKRKSYSRRNNLIFHDLPVSRADNEESCELKIEEFIKAQVWICDADSILVDIAHTLPNRNKQVSSVITKFTRRYYRNRIPSEKKRGWKNQYLAVENNIMSAKITEDFTKESGL